MAMGRHKPQQADLMMSWVDMPRSPGHAFYDMLQTVLVEGGFDDFAEEACRPFYAKKMGAPSIPPGRYFRMHLIGYFEGIDSERGIEWRCSDSLSLRDFLRLGPGERVPDHSWLSKPRGRLSLDVHERALRFSIPLRGSRNVSLFSFRTVPHRSSAVLSQILCSFSVNLLTLWSHVECNHLDFVSDHDRF